MATKRKYTDAVARAHKKYEESHYFKTLIRIPKELETAISEKASGSLNGYIVGLIKKDLDLVEENKRDIQ